VAWKLDWSAGRATLTTVPSIKAMLEPRMVAASTQGPAFALHGAPAFRDRMTPSSHGGFMETVDARAFRGFAAPP
jgi:hypothetical protein